VDLTLWAVMTATEEQRGRRLRSNLRNATAGSENTLRGFQVINNRPGG
jgi:hypothetical protein